MASVFDKLRKILALEQEQNYQNKAVIGGLDKFAEFWQNEAQAAARDEAERALVNEVAAALRDYPNVEDHHQRERIINDILQKTSGERVQKPSPPGRSHPQATVTPPPAREPTPPPPPRREPSIAGLDSPVTRLPGISVSYARKLQKLGVSTIRDLLYLFPRRYVDYSQLKTINQLKYGEQTTIIGNIWNTKARQSRGGTSIVTTIIADGTGTIEATWFNQPYLANKLKPGRQIVISGKVDEYLGRLVFQSPEWEPLEKELIHTNRLVPVYPLTAGLGARWLRRLMKRTVDYWTKRLPDHLPAAVRERTGLVDLETAINQIHFPDDWASLAKARRRISFDEFLVLQLGVLGQRHAWQSQPGRAIEIDRHLLDTFVHSLPYRLTAAQERVLGEITSDLSREQPMSRLLQGDVGSGKTVVATAAMLLTVASGAQAVLMAPTEILAEQHYKNITALLQPLAGEPGVSPVNVRLLTGSVPAKEKETIYDEIRSGQAHIVVGTHALIQEGVEFKDLALAIIDEQHRFGVAQRAALRQKGQERGYTPHVLVMSATPIPRTLALTVYGDLDISVIDEMPPGRQEIETHWLTARERERAYRFLRSQIEQGRQAFVICPLIEESEKVEAKAAVEEYERLQKHIFPDLRLGLLHGKMKGEEKEAVMSRFHRGELDILVSTSVVEVGIDVPNATVMLVEGADRFGLAQLHQFRGRVGRGEHKSYCLLVSDAISPDDPEQKTTWERLKAIESTTDGFVLAEKDLELRGPGEFFGTRQSGLPDLKLAKLSDVRVLEQARTEALAIFRTDPTLSQPEHRLLARQVALFWKGKGDLS